MRAGGGIGVLIYVEVKQQPLIKSIMTLWFTF